ncbi:hypothetical protein RhiirB3_70467 [Rhizophagus irregularis]|nr:hypothetical protein RhiirB3_70467 [Rhizophagus irregularis]
MDEITAQKKTQELYSSVNNLLNEQNIEIKKLSEKLNVKEDVIRNIMKEERPVATKRKPSTAFDIYCVQRRMDGADVNEDIEAWINLSKCDISTYSQIANDYNNEQMYETVQYIDDKKERERTLKQNIQELKNLCKAISQECGCHLLVVGVQSNIENSTAFGTGNLRDFCSDKETTINQFKIDLVDYVSNCPNNQEQISDGDNNNDDDSVTHEQKLSEKSEEYSPNSFDFTLTSNETTPDEYNSNGFNHKKRGVMDNDEDFNILITKNGRDVNLESVNVRSEVYRFLENKFQQDTKIKMSIPYGDWNKQESFVVSGWPRNIEFKEWDVLSMNEKKKVFMSLSRLQFHVRLDSSLSKERRASKKKRFV